MNSIYIEAKTILSNKPAMEYLDGCGAVWWINGQKFSSRKDIPKNGVISYSINDRGFLINFEQHWQRCTTALEFCQGVARVMGIPEPTFEEVNDQNDHTESHLKPEPIKGMAIDINLLGENEREYIDSIYGDSSVWQEKYDYCVYYPGNLQKSNPLRFNFFSQGHYFLNDLTITESPKVFMEYVAQQTGKEYPTISKMETVEHVNNSYKFKTYRILDSLDGIPLDKRFKLSEFPLPPFGKEVLFVIKGKFFRACVSEIKQNVIVLGGADRGFANDYLEHKDLDGEWMRIV